MPFDNARGFGDNSKGFGDSGFGDGFNNSFQKKEPFSSIGNGGTKSTFGSGFGSIGYSNDERQQIVNGFFNGVQNRVGVNSELGRMQVDTLVMVPAGSYYNQHYRPLTSHARRDNLDVFAEVTENGSKLNPATIARANFDFITPSARTSSEIASIANGWDTARFSFIMKVSATLAGDVDTTYLLFGYTSHVGCSMTGNVDPQMNLYFTRCISMRNMETRNSFGLKQQTPRIASANNILFRDPYSRNELFTLRPEDIIGNAALPRFVDDYNEYKTLDTRTVLTRSPKLSDMMWSNPSMYLSRSLSHYSNVLNNSQSEVPYDELLNGIQDESPANCTPLRYLRKETAWGEDMCVSWKELSSVFPELNHNDVSKFQVPQPAVLAGMDGRMGSENNNGAGYEHVISSRVAQELPALLIQNQLISIAFTITNDQVDMYNKPAIAIEGFEHMTGGEQMINSSLESFKMQFTDLIFTALSRGNQVGLTLSVNFSIYGNGSIRVNYNNGGMTPFNVPVFAETMSSMLVSNDSHSVNHLSASVGKLMEVVEAGNTHSSFRPKFGSEPSFNF